MTIRSTLLAATIGTALLFTQAHAGGPVIIEEPPEKIAAGRSEGHWLVPVVVGLVILGAIVSGGGDLCNGPDDTPEPQPGGC